MQNMLINKEPNSQGFYQMFITSNPDVPAGWVQIPLELQSKALELAPNIAPVINDDKLVDVEHFSKLAMRVRVPAPEMGDVQEFIMGFLEGLSHINFKEFECSDPPHCTDCQPNHRPPSLYQQIGRNAALNLQDNLPYEGIAPIMEFSALTETAQDYPSWRRPWGIKDAYKKDTIVYHSDRRWISTYEGQNAWEPGVFGWEQQVEEVR